MATPVNQRVKKRRDVLRAAGFRPVQICMPDTRRPDFAEECRRQSQNVAAADAADRYLDAFMDVALS
ncbi:antitoxin MazE family protein [Hoeflea ulvae]|uniref:Antitoxin MazE family protein n=1 Tax=Hoeflea ulvae TaxID=2983764 RepID=A0ABT3YIF9_9HYPH|nr:antitoxin MazE family protein [Hoeflea ulvae]MCY0095694.1 antitoxin MazE family protein [Hoeflea ulvae]